MISTFVLQDDVVDFFSFRATCHRWRSSTSNYKESPLAPSFRPKKWIMLSDIDGSPTKPKYFVNISNGRMLQMRVPEVNSPESVLTTSEGLLVICSASGTKVLNPFTRFSLELPPLILNIRESGVTGTAVISDCTVVVCAASFNQNGLAYAGGTIRYANEKSTEWETIASEAFLSNNICFRNILLYQDQLYTIDQNGVVKVLVLVPQPVVRIIVTPTFSSHALSYSLVESRGQLLIVRKVPVEGNHGKVSFEVFKVDIPHKTLIPMSNIGDQALFVANERTLSISASCFPTIEVNSIYFVRHINLMNKYRMGCVYNLTENNCKNLHMFSVLNEVHYSRSVRNEGGYIEQGRSIQPYSLIDHILCYCYQQAWSKGLMYYEHCDFDPFSLLH